jgi:DNA gyrase/topoisomerase IV subunit A
MGMSNMVLLDENSRPFRYDNANDIIDKFYEKRLPIYNIRKEYILNNLSSEIKTLNHRIQFIQAVINGQISIINKKKSSIYEALDKLSIPHEIYDKSMNHHLSEDDITELNLLIGEKQKEHDIIKETRIEKIWLNELAELEEAYKQTLVKTTTSQKVKVGASKSKARVVKKNKKLIQ